MGPQHPQSRMPGQGFPWDTLHPMPPLTHMLLNLVISSSSWSVPTPCPPPHTGSAASGCRSPRAPAWSSPDQPVQLNGKHLSLQLGHVRLIHPTEVGRKGAQAEFTLALPVADPQGPRHGEGRKGVRVKPLHRLHIQKDGGLGLGQASWPSFLRTATPLLPQPGQPACLLVATKQVVSSSSSSSSGSGRLPAGWLHLAHGGTRATRGGGAGVEAETHEQDPRPLPSLLPGPAQRPPTPQRQAGGPWWGWALWVCGVVARWAGELFSRALSRASSAETAADPAHHCGDTQGCWLDIEAQGGPPPHQPQGLTSSRRLWFSTSRLAIRVTSSLVSTGPAGGPRACALQGRRRASQLCLPSGSPFTAMLKQSPESSA